MKKFIFILYSAIFLLQSGCSNKGVFELFEGGSLDFGDPGKFVIVNYWAKWGAPCREEIPELNELQQDFLNEVFVVGVNYDQPNEDILMKEKELLKVEFPTLKYDPRSYFGLPPVSVLPETLIIDHDGTLLHRLIGPQTKSSIESLIIGE